jgi:hypothetical protein
VYSDELEDYFEGYLNDEFNTDTEDGSARQVSLPLSRTQTRKHKNY